MILTIKEICDGIQTTTNGRVHRSSEAITKGLPVRQPPLKEGLVQLTPGQALSIYIERLSIDGEVKGYQRKLWVKDARRIADALLRNEDVGEASLALDGGRVYGDDAQHRLVGCVMARRPIWAVIRSRNLKQRAQRFANQAKARRVPGDNLVLADDSPASRYVKAALVAQHNGTDHAWASLISEKTGGGRIGPNFARDMLLKYSLRILTYQKAIPFEAQKKFRAEDGDELAALLLCLGTPQTNTQAYRPPMLRALCSVAVLAVARATDRRDAVARWRKHMPSFDWVGHAYQRQQNEMRGSLVAHWNKRLSPSKKITLD